MEVKKAKRVDKTVEAVQWDGTEDHAFEIIQWSTTDDGGAKLLEFNDHGDFLAATNNGDVVIQENDWVIQGESDYYPCNPEDFENLYNVVGSHAIQR